MVGGAFVYHAAPRRPPGTAPQWRRRQLSEGAYDPDLLIVLDRELNNEPEAEVEAGLTVEQLQPGMRLRGAVHNSNGGLLVPSGDVLTSTTIDRLRALAAIGALEPAPIRVD
jgi:hypothetical protein